MILARVQSSDGSLLDSYAIIQDGVKLGFGGVNYANSQQMIMDTQGNIYAVGWPDHASANVDYG